MTIGARHLAVALLVPVLVLALSCSQREQSPAPCSLFYRPPSPPGACEEPGRFHDITWRYGAGTICTASCESELECPSQGARSPRCLDVASTGEYLCYLECRDDRDCPGGWVCQPLAPDGAVCLP